MQTQRQSCSFLSVRSMRHHAASLASPLANHRQKSVTLQVFVVLELTMAPRAFFELGIPSKVEDHSNTNLGSQLEQSPQMSSSKQVQMINFV